MAPTISSHPKVVLHIGLHKTGTRFLQREVFKNLDASHFSVNPRPLWPQLRQAMRHPGNREIAEATREAVNAWRQSGDHRTLVISEPHISGDMYSSHHDFAENADFIKELFPDAVILFFVRKQADWLQSAYRQQLVKGWGVPINVFLNFYDGEFRPRIHPRVFGGVRNVEALTLRFLRIYRKYADTYGPGRVYLFRQEDMRRSADTFKSRLAEAMDLERLPAFAGKKSQNRSFSALAIKLFFPGANRHYPRPAEKDAGRRQQSFLTSQFKRLRQAFIQHLFDRIYYHDWDLLQEHHLREKIDRYYAQENEELRNIAQIVLERGPQALEREQPRD